MGQRTLQLSYLQMSCQPPKGDGCKGARLAITPPRRLRVGPGRYAQGRGGEVGGPVGEGNIRPAAGMEEVVGNRGSVSAFHREPSIRLQLGSRSG